MTEEQDQRLRSWKYKDGKDKDTMKPKYESLCRCLFDEEIQVPENPSKPSLSRRDKIICLSLR
jgi:hypothetical protein